MRTPPWLIFLILLAIVGLGRLWLLHYALAARALLGHSHPGGAVPRPGARHRRPGWPAHSGWPAARARRDQRRRPVDSAQPGHCRCRGRPPALHRRAARPAERRHRAARPSSTISGSSTTAADVYAVDLEATRAVNVAAKRRVLFDASVPPGGDMTTLLAFETPSDTGALTLRVGLGYGEVELPR